MTDVPGERGRLQAPGRRTDDNSHHTLEIINEADGSWAIHGLGKRGVRLTRDVMVTLAESILSTAEECPAWCSAEPEYCFITDEGVRVHQQAPTCWEDREAEVRCESRLVDPGDEPQVYLGLYLRCLRFKSGAFSWAVPLDTVRRLRDQLTEHLDAASQASKK